MKGKGQYACFKGILCFSVQTVVCSAKHDSYLWTSDKERFVCVESSVTMLITDLIAYDSECED